MSLNKLEKEMTSKELKNNYKMAELNENKVLQDLQFTKEQLQDVLNVSSKISGFDVWKLKDYIDENMCKKGMIPSPYSVLKSNIWYSYTKTW